MLNTIQHPSKKYSGADAPWPPNFANLWWRHNSAWWLQDDLFLKKLAGLSPSRRLEAYVAFSQKRQAQFLSIAAKTCKERFPECAGFLVWMGHDACPAPSNTAIIDFDRNPKPAYNALRRIFRAKPGRSATEFV